ncbi:cache domain-containing protein [Arcobacter sp. CECT 8985]|uniref:cache domain-containing protein n=1 Tax=Arcobacter sp. CECT 8985 TaxID=1935424 RepID=UPI002159C797|nr:cache domain-containing protein [Arcobacter sp. CECT 8985]
MHFHLPNNHSFLRLHKPNIYNDDLTNSRYSVNYVNKYKKKISGLEMGNIFLGFRYVYPLFEHGKYIGSVETSLGIEAFTNRLEKLYNIKVKNENKLSHKIVTFLQLKNIENKNIGYFVIYKKNNKLEKIEEEVTKEYFAFNLINILVFY